MFQGLTHGYIWGLLFSLTHLTSNPPTDPVDSTFKTYFKSVYLSSPLLSLLSGQHHHLPHGHFQQLPNVTLQLCFCLQSTQQQGHLKHSRLFLAIAWNIIPMALCMTAPSHPQVSVQIKSPFLMTISTLLSNSFMSHHPVYFLYNSNCNL